MTAHILPCNLEMMLLLWASAMLAFAVPFIRAFIARFRK